MKQTRAQVVGFNCKMKSNERETNSIIYKNKKDKDFKYILHVALI